KILPLSLWARLYPYKSSVYFVSDKAGDLLVDRIGRMEHMQQDAVAIFTAFGYRPEDLKLRVENRTDYDRSHALDSRIAAIVAQRLPADCALFDALDKKWTTSS
ncbi:MAG: hypothetical protein RIC89_22985, partial [Pseudomonadales bacterium]